MPDGLLINNIYNIYLNYSEDFCFCSTLLIIYYLNALLT